MKFLNNYIGLLLVLICQQLLIAQVNEQTVGKINLSEVDNFAIVKAQVTNEEPLFKNNLTYNFVALKKSASGNYSSNKQSGEFSLKPEESKSVSEIRLNIEKGEEIRVFLFIKQEDLLVSKDSLVILSSEQQTIEQKVVKEEEFVLKGIVVDEVITKLGKDFHDYFYQGYRATGTLYPFIITLKEKPYFGRSSIVTVEADDRVIYQFLTKPDEEFLKSAVRQTLQNLNQYARQREILFKNNKM